MSVSVCVSSLQALVHWSGFHAVRSESEWCILLWCPAAQTGAARHLSSCWPLLLSSAPRVHKSTKVLRHKTSDFTPDVASQQTGPQSCIDYWQSFRNVFIRKAKIVDELWLLTEWHFIIIKTYYISQGRVEIPIRRGGQLCCSMLQIYFSVCLPEIIKIHTVQFDKIKGCNFCPTV